MRFTALVLPLIFNCIFTLPLALPAMASASASITNAPPSISGLPIPRFVSLRTDEINLRTGPGVRYPVEWVYTRAGLPVEVTAEFDTWRRVRDIEGSEGWVHQSMISGKRHVLVVGEAVQPVYQTAASDAPIMAKAEPGAQGELLNCENAWCEVKFATAQAGGASVQGFMPKGSFWGVYASEVLK